MKKSRKVALLAGVFLLLAGAVLAQNSVNSDSKPQLTQNAVIEIAKAAAKVEKIELEKYKITGCHYEFTDKDHRWTVFFEVKPPTPPGGHFLVWVDDQTKKATLMHGQ